VISTAEVLAGVALPAALGLVLGVMARLLPARATAAWAGAALLVATLAGHGALVAVQGGSLDPARQGFQGLFWGIAAAAAILLVPLPGLVRAALMGLAAGLGWWLTLTPLHPHALATGLACALGAGFIATMLALGFVSTQAERRFPCTCGLSTVVVVLTCAAICCAASGSLVMGEYAGVGAAAAAGLLLAWIRSGRPAPGLGWAASFLLVGYVGVNLGLLYSSLTWPAAVLLGLALPAAWIGELPVIARRPRWAAVIRVVAVAVVAGSAVVYTLVAGQPAASAGGGDASGYGY